jgi:hypothetical protein
MQMWIRIECGLDSRCRAGVWPNDRAGVRAVRIQGGKNEVWIRFGCGLDSRIYGILLSSIPCPQMYFSKNSMNLLLSRCATCSSHLTSSSDAQYFL